MPKTPAQTVKTASVCRVLVLGRAAYQALAAAFPLSAEAVLDNLLEAAQEVGVDGGGLDWGGGAFVLSGGPRDWARSHTLNAPNRKPTPNHRRTTNTQLVERELSLPISALEGNAKDLESLAVRYASPELYTGTSGGGGGLTGTAARSGRVSAGGGEGGGGVGGVNGAAVVPGVDSESEDNTGTGRDFLAEFVKRTGRPLGHSQRVVS
jgi:hypothetical protein